MKLNPHPFADMFPLMSEEERIALRASVKTSGLRDPIVLFQGKILDGRNRYAACIETKAKLRFIEFKGTEEEARSYVKDVNLSRRHLTQSQKACIAAQYMDHIVRDPKECVRIARETGANNVRKGYGKKQNNMNKSRLEASRIFGVCDFYITRARTLWLRAKPWFERVKNGEMTVSQGIYRWKDSLDYRPEEVVYNNRVYWPKTEEFIKRTEVSIPPPFEPYERFIRFIREMNGAGWILHMKVDKGQFYIHWYGNGIDDRGNSWAGYQPDSDFRRALVNEACSRLNKKPENNPITP